MNFDPARLSVALALCLCATDPAAAQDRPASEEPAPVDPLESLPPLPDFGIEWPDATVEPSDPAATTQPQDKEPAGPSAIRYSIQVSGLKEIGLADEFKSLSVLESGEEEVTNFAQLDRRARDDAKLVDRLLRSKGYYGGDVDVEITPGNGAQAGRATVAVQVTPGPRYTFRTIDVKASGAAPESLVIETLALKPGAPVDAAEVQAAEDRLRLGLPQHGYAFAQIGERDIVIDHATRTATYSLPVSSGPLARIGSFRVEGDELIPPRHVARLARFDPGDVYDSRKIDDLRAALIDTGLFGTVAIQPVRTATAADGSAVVDLAVRLEKAPLRTIAATAGYGTGEGFRLEVSWQHRNFIPPEGALTLRGVAGTQEQRAAAELRFSNWQKRDQALSGRVEASHENRDAYEATSFTLGARIERETNLIWQKKWLYSFGAELLASDERDKAGVPIDDDDGPNDGPPLAEGERRTFFIAAFPARLAYDGTDDLLDPHRSFRLSARASPEASLQSGFFAYTRVLIDGSAYLPMMNEDLVLAGRVRAGSIFGADRARIAPSRRYYAGGGGSVRGYQYQEIGPENEAGDPIGGRSLAEFSIEARYRFGDFGIVPFLDGGQVYTSTYPTFDSFRWGAGIGARYYTNFGPIRFDVATPLDPRPGDPKVAVYVAIGQAF